MVKQVNVHEAKTNFSKLMAEVEAGEEIIVARAGTPIIKLVKIEYQRPNPIVPGFAKDILGDWSEEKWRDADEEFRSLFRDRGLTP